MLEEKAMERVNRLKMAKINDRIQRNKEKK